MKFKQKQKEYTTSEIWEEYCGFLDLPMNEYMHIQKRLMDEQIHLWSNCPLGQSILNGKSIKDIDDFRENFPLTSYDDYADVLLSKRGDMLPETPIVWIQTTWEGGKHPVKLAPYSKSMLATYQKNVMGCLLLATSTQKGKYYVENGNTMLYGLAPLPYATGLLPLLLDEEIELEYLPSVKEAQQMTFKQRNILGFKYGLSKGIDLFFGVGSVAYFVSKSFTDMKGSKSKGSTFKFSPRIAWRYLKARSICRRENREMLPKDLFKLKGFMCAGTDNRCYKDDLERMWGIRPVEVFAGTEPGCVGTETWARNGLYFFPDACFYEFIPEAEMLKNLDDNNYKPKTCLIDQVESGQSYELVISLLKGGAFMRYRVGDVYRCLGVESREDGIHLPRFEYIDRIPTVIDIAGFTRITEYSINHVIKLSGLAIKDWVAAKEYSPDNRPYLHLYVEVQDAALQSSAVTREILKEHLSVYFKYVDNDYKDLQKILGIDPLEITLLKCGTFASYYKFFNKTIRRINPKATEITDLIKAARI